MIRFRSKFIRTKFTSKTLALCLAGKPLIIHFSPMTNDFRRRDPEDELFKSIFNELTNKVKLYKVKGFDKLSLSFSQYFDESGPLL